MYIVIVMAPELNVKLTEGRLTWRLPAAFHPHPAAFQQAGYSELTQTQSPANLRLPVSHIVVVADMY